MEEPYGSAKSKVNKKFKSREKVSKSKSSPKKQKFKSRNEQGSEISVQQTVTTCSPINKSVGSTNTTRMSGNTSNDGSPGKRETRRVVSSRIIKSELLSKPPENLPNRYFMVPVIKEKVVYKSKKDVHDIVKNVYAQKVQYVPKFVEVCKLVELKEKQTVQPTKIIEVPREVVKYVSKKQKNRNLSPNTNSTQKIKYIEKQVPTVVAQKIVPCFIDVPQETITVKMGVFEPFVVDAI